MLAQNTYDRLVEEDMIMEEMIEDEVVQGKLTIGDDFEAQAIELRLFTMIESIIR